MTSQFATLASLPALASGLIVAQLLVFCRVGSCIMVMPGISSSQIPVQVRLFIAIGVSLAISSLVLDRSLVLSLVGRPLNIVRLAFAETLAGVVIGFLGRLFFLALETLATGSAAMLGVSNPFGVEVEPGQVLPPLATLITLSATVLLFVTDLHWEVIRGLVASYRVIPLGDVLSPRYMLGQIGRILAMSFSVSLRVCAPFVLYSITVNTAISLTSRVAPQISIYFIAAPFVIAGGFLLLYFVIGPLLLQFLQAFATFLALG